GLLFDGEVQELADQPFRPTAFRTVLAPDAEIDVLVRNEREALGPIALRGWFINAGDCLLNRPKRSGDDANDAALRPSELVRGLQVRRILPRDRPRLPRP